jgi:multiple antibiotic resistance protein
VLADLFVTGDATTPLSPRGKARPFITGIALAIVVLSVAVYFCYGFAPAITARVAPQTVQGILRVIAFVLMCIGVQITWNGASALLKTVLAP